MYSNGGGLGAMVRNQLRQEAWRRNEDELERRVRNGKRFVSCICPKCTAHHYVYMMWTGRGVPRKYCCNCKPMVSGYDEAAVYEASISMPGNSKKRGRRYEGE
jgi:Zn ribbon nucleic-acid-binding protein